MSKRGSPYLRRALWQASTCAVIHDPTLKAFFEKKRLEGKPYDIWYATNIEIYEYIEAYHSLVFSADSSKIYNPTLKQLWFEIDDTLHSISPNEFLKIN